MEDVLIYLHVNLTHNLQWICVVYVKNLIVNKFFKKVLTNKSVYDSILT